MIRHRLAEVRTAMTEATDSLYRFTAPLLDGRVIALEEFRGQVLIIVNTASKCGFTPQYGGLEELHRAYHRRGFSVLGFPCNQFGGQESGSASEIAAFCEKNYGVSFPVFAKIDVNGPNEHPLYRFLKREKPGALGFLTGGRISWNFTKFLCARSGSVEFRFAPSKPPEKLAYAIEDLLHRS